MHTWFLARLRKREKNALAFLLILRVRRINAYNWKAIVSPTEALTTGGLYVRVPFSPTDTTKVAAEARPNAANVERRAENFMLMTLNVGNDGQGN